jgi:hypothetical protein
MTLEEKQRLRTEPSRPSRSGVISSHLSMIFVSAASLIFFTYFHQLIAWYNMEADGTITRIPVLTGDYFTWLPINIVAAVLAILAYTIMIVFDRDWFSTAAQIVINIVGIFVALSLASIFPFDFSSIPNALAVRILPIAVTGFLIFMAVVYAVSVIVLSGRLLRSIRDRASNR